MRYTVHMELVPFSRRVFTWVGFLCCAGAFLVLSLPAVALPQALGSGTEITAPSWKKVRYVVIPGEEMPTAPPLPRGYRGRKPEPPPSVSPEDLTSSVRQLLSVVLPPEQYELIPSERLGPQTRGQPALERLFQKQGDLQVQVAVSIGLRAEPTSISVKKKRGSRIYTVVEKGWKYILLADIQDVPAKWGDAPSFRQSYTFPLGADQARIEQVVRGRRSVGRRLSLDNLEPVAEALVGHVKLLAKPQPIEIKKPLPPVQPAVVKQEPPVVATQPPATMPLPQQAQAADVEDPLLELRRRQETETFRPPWRPAFVVEAGYLLSARALSANGGVPVFPLAPGPGLGAFVSASGFSLGAELYPFAFSRSISRHASGLGFRGRFGMPFWTDVPYVHYSKYDPLDPARLDQSSPRVTTPYTHTGRSAEAAIFWRTSFFQKAWRPEFKIGAVYLHQVSQFTAQQPTNVPIPVPSVSYHGMGGELGVELWMSRWFHVEAGGVVGKIFDAGEINALQQYGYGGGWQWRVYGEAALQIHSFSLGARVTYDRRELSFNGTGQMRLTNDSAIVNAATDQSLTTQIYFAFRFSTSMTFKKWEDDGLRKRQ